MTKRPVAPPRLAGPAGLFSLLTLLAFGPRCAQAQEVPLLPVETQPARGLGAPGGDPAPVGALLAPPDSVAVGGPVVDSAGTPGLFIGPTLPGAVLGVATTPAPDTLVTSRNRRIPARLRTLERTIPLVYNPYVRGFIDYFTIRNPKYTRRMLERQTRYFPMFEKALAKYNLPSELKYLSVVESALNPRASSKALAVGLWQFIPEAARDYKLVINSWKDERMDPEKATDAACRYLKNLNRAFGGDWELALAAYNCGPGNVRRAIRRAGGRANFWSIFPYLPQETRGYVPSFTAVVYAMNFASDYSIEADNPQLPVSVDTVLLPGPLDLGKFSQALGLETNAIHDLNTELRRPLLPAVPGGYALRIPAEKRLAFDALNRAEVLAACVPATNAAVALARDSARSANQPRYVAGRCVVRRGESIQRIAARNGCTVAQLRAWNHLRAGRMPRIGQSLVVYKAVKPKHIVVDDPSTVALAKAEAAKAAAADSNRSTLAPAAHDAAPATAAAAPTTAPASTATVTALTAAQLDSIRENGYTVRRGDNLFQIARMFNLPVGRVADWNNLKDNRVLLGQTLALRAPAAEASTATEAVAASAPVPVGAELAGSEYSAAPPAAPVSRSAARATAARAAWVRSMQQRARVIHLVQPGDTLWQIANKRGVSVQQLRRLNKLKSDALKPGQKIVVS